MTKVRNICAGNLNYQIYRFPIAMHGYTGLS